MPPILAGILAIYGLIIAVIISNRMREKLPLYTAFMQFGAGVSVGMSGLAAGCVYTYPSVYLHMHMYMQFIHFIIMGWIYSRHLTDKIANSFAIGIIGDVGVRGIGQQPKLFVGMILILIFAEVLGEFCPSLICRNRILCSYMCRTINFIYVNVLVCVGLYGMIVALLMITQSTTEVGQCL